MSKQVLDIAGNKTDKYRKEGSSLFEYNLEANAYVCCYTGAGKTKGQLIAAYESQY